MTLYEIKKEIAKACCEMNRIMHILEFIVQITILAVVFIQIEKAIANEYKSGNNSQQ